MTASAVVSLTPGYHAITVEYYENKGLAFATFSWRPVSVPAGVWHGEYFDNAPLLGPPSKDSSRLPPVCRQSTRW